MNNILKPCPFCGGEAKLMRPPQFAEAYAFIACTKCRAAGPLMVIKRKLPPRLKLDDPILAPVLESWNRRV